MEKIRKIVSSKYFDLSLLALSVFSVAMNLCVQNWGMMILASFIAVVQFVSVSKRMK